MLGSGLAPEERSFLNPHYALWGLASHPFPHAHTSAVSGSGQPMSTNLLGQGSLFALPRAKPGGPDPEYCVTQPKHSFLRLPLFMKRKSNPGIHAFLASSQVLKCHFWGDALPRAGCSLQGNKNPSPSSPAHLWWWASFRLPLLQSPSPHLLGGPVRPELGCWISVPALGGAGAFQPREPPKKSFAIASVYLGA